MRSGSLCYLFYATSPFGVWIANRIEFAFIFSIILDGLCAAVVSFLTLLLMMDPVGGAPVDFAARVTLRSSFHQEFG